MKGIWKWRGVNRRSSPQRMLEDGFLGWYDTDCANVSKDNGINEDVSQGLEESHSAGNDVRHYWLSSSKILATRVGRKNFHLNITCWNVRTLLQKGKVENVKHKMAWLGINVLWKSETRWPGEDDYKSDGFRIIHSEGEESQRGVAIILDKRRANCVE